MTGISTKIVFLPIVGFSKQKNQIPNKSQIQSLTTAKIDQKKTTSGWI
jgi:hypothetical protein